MASDDRLSPFYGKSYNEFSFTQKIYNYFIHPQWDDFGSETLYMKILYVNYEEGYCFIELIGEWNDCLHNDIALLKREIADRLYDQEIYRFVFFCDNVLNFHSSDDDSYYEEWREDISEHMGWIAFMNVQDHVLHEMNQANLNFHVHLGENLNDINWQRTKPKNLIKLVAQIISAETKQLH